MTDGSYRATPFAPSREQFETIVNHLRSTAAGDLKHGEIEEYLESAGREMLRRLFQDHLDLRRARETRQESVDGKDGIPRTHARERKRDLVTVFGAVEVRRLAYSAPEVGSLCPRDVVLNLPPERHSDGLRRKFAEESSRGSFEEAQKAVERATGVAVPKRQAEQLARRASLDFDAYYAARKATGPEPTDDPLVLTMDGKGIVMRKEDLREEARKEAERREAAGATSDDKRQGRKRMATVAAVYSIAPHVRTAEDVMGGLESVGKKEHRPKVRPHARNKRVWASVADPPERVTRDVFREAMRRDPQKKRPWVVLVDGDPNQIDRIKAQARRHHVAITLILDFIHVLEYLWKAAHALHGEGRDDAVEEWVRDRALKILDGRCTDVAAGVRRSATLRELRGKEREAADSCANYLLNHAHMLRYNEYLAQGMPIASGVVEGACRHLIQDRMDITGARWGLKGAEAVLRLRSLRSSGDFAEYWAFHQRQELHRNHLSAYSDLGHKAHAA
jgi:hypothetical protein